MALTSEQIRDVLGEYVKVGPEPAPEPARPGLTELRRGRRRPARRPPARVALVERDGLVVWEWGFVPARAGLARPIRRAGRLRAAPRNEIFSDDLQPLGVNQIGGLLLDFDRKRNPAFDGAKGWTLQQYYAGPQQLGELLPPSADVKNVLVIVHGTASSCGHLVSEIQRGPGGAKLLSDAAQHYSAVLAFEHPTVAFSPVLNALDLSDALAPYGNCAVDIVCHSRGGLISSWWMHMVDHRPRAKRCVFVGSPLQGTNLANPAKLRSSLHLLASYGRLLGSLGDAAGFIALPMTIIRIAASVVDFTAKVPLLDAALAMIPGLSAQSRIENNSELARLNRRKSSGTGAPTHFYIQANFNSKDPAWKVWQYFTDNPTLRLADAAVDTFVFPGENDLIVDTISMSDAVGGPTLTFASADGRVHHTNYFQQKETIDHIREWLEIPI
jgi:hypothetical protein